MPTRIPRPPLDKDGWPLWLPLLEPGDIGALVHTTYDSSLGEALPHCTAGWINWVCHAGEHPSSRTLEVIRRMRKAHPFGRTPSLTGASDEASPRERALAWRMMADNLGYTVPGDDVDVG